MNCPDPWQRGQGTAVITWPRIDWRIRRNSPAPWQSGQRTAAVPGCAPLPSQLSQCTGVVHLHLAGNAEHRLSEGEAQHHLGIGTGHGTGPAAPAAGPGPAHAVEEGVEQVAQAPAERIADAPVPAPGPNTPSGP